MKKKLSKILILFIIFTNLFAPLSVGLSKNNNIEVKSNIVQAADAIDLSIDGYKNAFSKNSSLTQTSTTYINDNSADTNLTIVVDTGVPTGSSSFLNWFHVKRNLSAGGYLSVATGMLTLNLVQSSTNYGTFQDTNTFILKATESGTNKTGYVDITKELLINNLDFNRRRDQMVNVIQLPKPFNSLTPSGQQGLSLFKPGTGYTLSLYYLSNGDETNGVSGGEVIPGLESNGSNYYKIAETSITTATKEQQVVTTGAINERKTVPGQALDGTPECRIDFWNTLGGCTGQILYWLLFKPSSFIFGLSGKMLDWTLMYSISDTSYRSSFVVEGWGIVRDFCNMFFIFVLLYIAFGTILNLHSVKTKEMIINVVIIGLLINFSLFATQVIIDASNILTRVFYNQKTIITGTVQKDASGNPLPVVSQLGAFGEIKLSEAIVSKVNPQELIMQSQKVGAIQTSGSTEQPDANGISPGAFIIVILLATAVNCVGLFVFFSSAVIFIARVVGLWLAMILAPLAFFSYIVPQLQDVEMIGWKKWWPDTLKMAFLAPIFAFFMYLIVGFMSKGLGIMSADSKTGLNFVVSIVVPFVFIMVLLMKAKDIAKKMSGTIGESISKAGAMVGGLALGVATGGAAMAGRATLGRIGSSIASSSKLADAESRGVFGAKMLRNLGSAAGKGSFDARGVKIAGKGLSDTGLTSLGKPKEGGYLKAEQDKIAKRTNRKEELKKVATKGLEVDKRKAEVEKKKLENTNSGELHRIEAQLAIYRQQLKDTTNQIARDEISKKIGDENQKKFDINSGGIKPDGTYNTNNGKISKVAVDDSVTAATTATDAADNERATFATESARINKMESDARIAGGGIISDPKIAADIKTARDAAVAKLAVAETAESEAVTKSTAALAAAAGGTGNAIKDYNKEIIDTQHHIDVKGNDITEQYAKWIGSTRNQIANIFSTGDTKRGRDEAIDNMYLNIVTKSSDSSGGGGHSAPAAAAPVAHATPVATTPAGGGPAPAHPH